MTRKKSEDAVSPVIGVMLMLVVVIIIAAVVTVFATGTVAETEVAPIAKLDVEILSNLDTTSSEGLEFTEGSVPSLRLYHISGDSLDTADLKLSFSWDCEEHGHHTSTYQSGTGRFGINDNTESPTGAFGLNSVSIPSQYAGEYIEPLYINYGLDPNSPFSGAFFGSHILKRGEVMMAYELHLSVENGIASAGNPAMDALFNGGDVISEKDAVTNTAPKCHECGGDLDDNMECQTCYKALYEAFYNTDDIGTSRPKAKEVARQDPDNIGKFSLICSCGGLTSKESTRYNVGVPKYYNTYQNTNGICSSCGKSAMSSEGGGYTAGIMECLPEGTAVEVMITHIPSNKVIFEKRVFVE